MKRAQIRQKKRRKKLIKNLLLVLLISFLLCICYIGYLFIETYQAASKTYDDLNRDKSEKREEKISVKNNPFSVLLMGIENYSSGGSSARVDTLILLTINPNDKSIKMLSIPRDTRTEIIGRNSIEKIGHSYAYGQEKMTINTVENLLDIPIDYYATVDFDGFKNIIDILGGVEVEVPFDFSEPDEQGKYIYFNEGPAVLDGREALAYVRMRKQDPLADLGRIERQKEVIRSLINKSVSLGTIFKIDELANEIGKNVKTNIKISEAISIYRKFMSFEIENLESIKLDGKPEYIDNISYYILDDDSLKQTISELKKHLQLKY